MKLKLVLIFLLFFIAAKVNFCLGIVENKKITLNEAIDITLRANPKVKIQKLNTETSINKIKIADRLQNPTIETFQNIGPAGEGNPQQIGVDYTIEILKRGKRKEYAKSEALAAYDDEKYYEQVLILNVKRAYIDLLLKKANYRVLKNQENLTNELYETAKKQAEKNIIPHTEVIQAKIALNRAIIYTNVAKSEVIKAQNRLNATMNTSEINYDTKDDFLNDNYAKLNTISPLDDKLNFEKIKNYALENRFDLLKAKQEIESAKNNLRVVRSQLIPDLEIDGGYAYQSKGVSSTGRFMSGGYVQVGLTNIPLIYQYQPEIKNAKLDIEKAQLKYEDIKVDVIRDITDAWEKYTIAKTNLNFYNDELLKDSKELLQESKENLDKKQIDITAFLVSKKIYLESMLYYHEALAEYYISYAELLKEMNMTNWEMENI